MNPDSIFWLKQIYEAIKGITSASSKAAQSDWNESDSDAASYIKNKPVIPTPASVTVIEGTVATDAFTPAEGQATFAEALALIMAGNFVYLQYEDSGDDVIELVTAASVDAMATKNLTWSAE